MTAVLSEHALGFLEAAVRGRIRRHCPNLIFLVEETRVLVDVAVASGQWPVA